MLNTKKAQSLPPSTLLYLHPSFSSISSTIEASESHDMDLLWSVLSFFFVHVSDEGSGGWERWRGVGEAGGVGGAGKLRVGGCWEQLS